jgi:serine/threonine protein kinase
MLAHVNTPPKHPSDVNAEVPRPVGDIVMKALAKEPDQRFQSGQEFRGALETVDSKAGSSPLAAASRPAAMPEEPKLVEPAAVAAFAGTPSLLPVTLEPAVQAASIFGDSFLSKLGLSLAVCAITFLLGSAALYALMVMTKR